MMGRVFQYLVILICAGGCAVNPAERNDTGNSLYSHGAFDQALIAYQAAQVLSPDSPEPYLNAGLAFARVGRWEDALAALNQALKTADDEVAAKIYYNLGNVYFEKGQFAEAFSAYQQTLYRTPGDDDARYNLELALSKIKSLPLSSQSDTPGTIATSDPSDNTLQVSTPLPQLGVDESTDQGDPAAYLQGTLTTDEAARLLDSIQQNQDALLDEYPMSPDGRDNEKDW